MNLRAGLTRLALEAMPPKKKQEADPMASHPSWAKYGARFPWQKMLTEEEVKSVPEIAAIPGYEGDGRWDCRSSREALINWVTAHPEFDLVTLMDDGSEVYGLAVVNRSAYALGLRDKQARDKWFGPDVQAAAAETKDYAGKECPACLDGKGKLDKYGVCETCGQDMAVSDEIMKHVNGAKKTTCGRCNKKVDQASMVDVNHLDGFSSSEKQEEFNQEYGHICPGCIKEMGLTNSLEGSKKIKAAAMFKVGDTVKVVDDPAHPLSEGQAGMAGKVVDVSATEDSMGELVVVTVEFGDDGKHHEFQQEQLVQAKQTLKAEPAPAEKKPKEAPKKAAAKPKDSGVIHCPSCGSAGPWTILEMHLTISDVPASKLTTDEYSNVWDDTKGDSAGWDYVQDPMVKCDKCGMENDYNELVEMAGKKAAAPEPAA